MNNSDTIDSQILDLMLRAGSRWVLWLLIGLSLAAVAVMGERLWFFIQEKKPASRIAGALKALRDKGPADAAKLLEGSRSIEVAVLRACLDHAGEGAASVDEHKAAVLELERQRYEKRLAFLGTLGNNAPFIGLFGTVLGIIRAFHDLAGSSLQGTQAVMTGIAEALVATGVGLLVALPAVATYNAFMRHVETAVASAEALAHEVLAYLKKEP
ncbi:MAG: MotA/TolQ/ExbB proton channel family protein [Deltaproteobacteria bacterium]|nr:MotA/TolQ/ExbB proton channel family protein [Deltaproteobacteria bacterium]